jgi:hypothetical protein
MDLQTFGKLLVLVAIGLALVGAALWVGGRLGLGSLPGDIRADGERWSCYVPIVSMIVVSIVLTLIVNIVARLLNR